MVNPGFDVSRALRSLVDNAPGIILAADLEARIRYINHTTPGLSPAEVIGCSLYDFTPPEEVERVRGYVGGVLSTGVAVTYEIRSADELGGLWYSVQVGPLTEGESVVGVSMILTDITPQKTAELTSRELATDLERSNLDLEQFAFAASHDLREPLRMISSFSELLLVEHAADLDEEALEGLRFIHDGALRMTTLVGDLLEYSRVGRRELTPTAVSLDHLLAQVLTDLAVLVEERNARVTHDPLPEVTAEATPLRRVLQNLVHNAIKFSEGPPEIHLTATTENGHHLISVLDRGIGIRPEYAERIFRPFQRLHARSAYPGSGLGLAIARKVIAAHGGELNVHPREGGGSIFRFTLPLAPRKSAKV